MKIIIHPFPAPADNNMFLKLLYKEVDGHGFNDAVFKVEPRSLLKIFKNARRGKDKHVIHVHWEAVLYGSKFVIKSLILMGVNFTMLFILKKIYGMKICWTMHNFKSHDYPHPLIDRFGRSMLFSIADALIIMQESVYKEWYQAHPQKDIRYIPLGNYIGAYTPTLKSSVEIRKEFGLQADDIVLLSFGTVKPYKKVDEIIKVFKQTNLDSKIKLCIIGSAKGPYATYLDELISSHPDIIFKNMFVKDEEVVDILKMADYSVFWYDDTVLTSAGLTLSLSYGTPVIVRDIPAAERVRDGLNGFLFNNADELADIFKKLPRTSRPSKEQVIRSIENESWALEAKSFMQLCADIFKR